MFQTSENTSHKNAGKTHRPASPCPVVWKRLKVGLMLGVLALVLAGWGFVSMTGTAERTYGQATPQPLAQVPVLVGQATTSQTEAAAEPSQTEESAIPQKNAESAEVALVNMKRQFDAISTMDVTFSFQSTMMGKKISGNGIFKKDRGSFRHEITYVLENGQSIKTTVLLDDVNHLLWSDQPLMGLSEPVSYEDGQIRYYRLDLDKVDQFVNSHRDILPELPYPWYRRCWVENLIQSLQENFVFGPATSVNLSVPPQNAETNTANARGNTDVPCYQLTGYWKKDQLEKLEGNRKDLLSPDMHDPDLGMLVAGEIPTKVILYLDSRFLPYRIEFSRPNQQDASEPQYAWIHFYNLVSDLERVVHFSDQYFHFNATSSYRNINDLTQWYIKELGNLVKLIEASRAQADENPDEPRTFQ